MASFPDDSIPGIHDYCDRWCRTCAFTGQCRLYRDVLSVPVTPKMVAAMRRATSALRAMDRLMDEQAGKRRGKAGNVAAFEPKPAPAEGSILIEAAGDYARFVFEWFEALPGTLRALPRKATEANPAYPVHVVAYHHVIIGLKVSRAVQGRQYGLLEDGDVQNDANGSAKVALLSIARSKEGWRLARELPGVESHQADEAEGRLTWITIEINRLFPRAMEFVRPGFDEVQVPVKAH